MQYTDIDSAEEFREVIIRGTLEEYTNERSASILINETDKLYPLDITNATLPMYLASVEEFCKKHFMPTKAQDIIEELTRHHQEYQRQQRITIEVPTPTTRRTNPVVDAVLEKWEDRLEKLSNRPYTEKDRKSD